MKLNKILFLFFAIGFIILSFVLNKDFIAFILTRDGEINHEIYFYLINMLQIFLFLSGLFFFLLIFLSRFCSTFLRYLKTNYKNYLLLLFSLLVGLIFIESFLYFLSPDDFSNFHFILTENKSALRTQTNLEYNTTIKLNSAGFRDGEFIEKKEGGSYRILIFGDSFVFGIGVEQNESFPYLLEKKLNQNSSQRFEVYNFGIPGTPPSSYLKVLEKNAQKYNPNLIIVSFFVGNDIFKGHLGLEKLNFLTFPLFRKLIRKKLFNIDTILNEPVFENSKIGIRYVDYTKQGLISPIVILKAYYYPDIAKYYTNTLKIFNENDYVKDILLALNSRSEDLNAAFLLMLVPEQFQVSGYDLEQHEEIGYIINDSILNDTRIQDAITLFALQQDIPVLDLLPYFKKFQKPTYYKIDPHWNQDGHELAANILYEKIKKSLSP